jgi:ribosome biogenesis GTPase A
MAVQWFPGHMFLTQKAITERIKTIDVVIEMLDARLPGSSANPMLQQLTGHKPTLKVLNKQDLADPAVTAQWLAHYQAQENTRALALDTAHTQAAQALVRESQALAPNRFGLTKPLRILICGIPNVGKSTLINRLMGKRAAKAADEAGVTKSEQRLALADDVYLFDTPGMLWPRIIVAQSGYNLAASGAVGKNAFDDEEVALELLAYLQTHYAAELCARYQIQSVADVTEDELLEHIGRKRGALLSGGRINLQKAAELVIHDFRSAAMGRVSLETPLEFAAWLKEGKQLDAERQLRKDALREAGFIRKKPVAKTNNKAKPAKR